MLWSKGHSLVINVSKTEEIIFYYRSVGNLSPITLNNEPVRQISSYKYLGLIMDNRLSSEVHVDKRCRRVQQKMYFLRRLRLFKVAQRVKLLFYHACIESILLYGIADCFDNLKFTLRSQLNRLVCTAMKVVGLGIYPNLQSIFDKVILKQAMKMTRDPSHVLQREFELLPSGRCFRSPMSRYNCYKNSFVPLATRLLNSNSSDKTVWLLLLMLVFFFGYAVFLICIAQN